MGRDDIPVAVEILDSAGNVVAGGERAEPAAAPRGPRWRPGKTWIIGLITVAGMFTALFVLVDDPEPRDPEISDPLALLALDTLDLTVGQGDATFPLFGRSWDHDLIVAGETVLQVDLNTGRTIELGGESGGDPLGPIRAIRVIDRRVFSFGTDGVHELTEKLPLRVAPDTSTFAGQAITGNITGNYVYADTFGAEEIAFTHLATGREIHLGGAARFAAVGDDLYYETGGILAVVDADDRRREWARGELLAIGRNHIAWRECPAVDTCRYWAGVIDDPRAVPLGPSAEAVLTLPGRVGRELYRWLEFLSPSGRYGWRYETTGDQGTGPGITLVDLQSDATITFPGSGAPVLSPDETAVFVTGLGATIAVDSTTGDAVRLALPGIGEAPIAFLPHP